MVVEEELVRLRAENERLGRELAETRRGLVEARQVIATLEQRIADLEQGSDNHPPTFGKPNRPKPSGPKPSRKKRASDQNHARRRETATRVVQHAHDRCPECDYRLRGQSLDYSRQVIELPEPQPIEIIEHRVIKRYCPHCQRWQAPKLDLSGQVLGQGRFGVRLVSLIATLRTTLRLPLERIRDYLQTLYQLTISEGEIVYLLDQVSKATKGEVAGLKREVQGSAIVHADETGWLEAGLN
jgi:transposase